MKFGKFSAFILSVAALISALFGLAACGGESYEFEDGGYEQIESYGYSFRAEICKRGPVTLVLPAERYSPEEAKALFETVEQDYAALKAVLGNGEAVRLEVLPDEGTSALPDGFYENGTAYVKRDLIESGAYRLYLSAGYLGTGEPWKMYAARAAVFGAESSVPRDALASYLGAHPEAASLFAAYFNGAFADEETRSYAVAGAEAFGAYLAEAYTPRAILGTGLTEDRTRFLRWLGLDVSFSPAHPVDWLDDATYTSSARYPLVIGTKTRTYSLVPVGPLQEYGAPYAFDTPARVLDLLSEAHAAEEKALGTIETQAPDVYKTVKARYDGHIDYFLTPDQPGIGADVAGHSVSLNDPGALAYETARYLIGGEKQNVPWLEEGVALYFSEFLSPHKTETSHRFYLAFSADESAYTGDDLAFVRDVKARYSAVGGSLDDVNAYDHVRMMEAIAYVTVCTPAYKQTVNFPWATQSVGEGLSSAEAYLYAKYLIARCGMDAVLAATLSGDPAKLGSGDFRTAFVQEVQGGNVSWALKLPPAPPDAFYNDVVLFALIGVAVAIAAAVVLLLAPKKKKK